MSMHGVMNVHAMHAWAGMELLHVGRASAVASGCMPCALCRAPRPAWRAGSCPAQRSPARSKWCSKMFSHPGCCRGPAAGEFCIVPDPAAAGGHRLVIDNNSGTYAPLAQHLPRMRQLFLENFPAMVVETLAADDPRLEWYHQQCPSRV